MQCMPQCVGQKDESNTKDKNKESKDGLPRDLSNVIKSQINKMPRRFICIYRMTDGKIIVHDLETPDQIYQKE